MAAQPQSTGNEPPRPLRRHCRQCGKAIRLADRFVGMPVKCPGCGSTIQPAAGEGLATIEYPERPHRVATTIGWSASLAFHILLLTLFAGATWFSGLGMGGGEKEVGIVIEPPGTNIETGRADLSGFQAERPELALADDRQAAVAEPILELSLGSLEASAGEKLLGVDLMMGDSSAQSTTDWSAFAGSGGGEGGGTASFFGITARGSTFVYVVDYSGSMTGDKIRAATDELIRSLTALDREKKFFIIFFNDQHRPMPGDKPVKATEPNKRNLIEWVNQSALPSGGTDPRSAMLLALSLQPDAIWLLSDGLFDESACEVIRAANPGARVVVHTIAFFENIGEPILKRIAEENRGIYRFVSPADAGLAPPGRGGPR